MITDQLENAYKNGQFLAALLTCSIPYTCVQSQQSVQARYKTMYCDLIVVVTTCC